MIGKSFIIVVLFAAAACAADSVSIKGAITDAGTNEARPKSYPLLFWPLGDAATTPPLTVFGGSEAGVGTINLTKITPGRVRSSIPLSQCGEGGIATVTFDLLAVHDSAMRGSLQVTCGSAFTVADLSPGTWLIKAMTTEGGLRGGAVYGPTAPNRFVLLSATAESPLPNFAPAETHIAEGSDSDLDLVFAGGIAITTRIRGNCGDGWESSIRDLQIAFDQPGLDGASFSQNQNGQWRIAMPEATSVRLRGLRGTLVFKEVVSQGRATGSMFIPITGVSKQTAEIVLTDKPTMVAAQVSQDDKPAAGAVLLFARWPLIKADDFPVFDGVACDSDGNCRAAGLSPGTYRVEAVAGPDWEKRDMPGVVEDWLVHGETVTLEEGEGKALRMEMRPAR